VGVRCASLKNDLERRGFSTNSMSDGQPFHLKNYLLKHGLRPRETSGRKVRNQN
jgi:hypothetical protein